MIARLRGEVSEVGAGRVVVDVHGVGYEVQVPEATLAALPLGERVDLHVRQVFREDDVSLYGFPSNEMRRLFDQLRAVKGCGPKTSLALLSELGDHGVADAIGTQDVKMLTRATGVGPRLAERIIVELKDKMLEVAFGRRLAVAVPAGRPRPVGDVLLEALIELGFRRVDAEAAAEDAREQSDELTEQIKIATRRLMR